MLLENGDTKSIKPQNLCEDVGAKYSEVDSLVSALSHPKDTNNGAQNTATILGDCLVCLGFLI